MKAFNEDLNVPQTVRAGVPGCAGISASGRYCKRTIFDLDIDYDFDADSARV